LMSSRTSGGMLSALTSRVGNFVLHQNVSYRVALEQTDRTIQSELVGLLRHASGSQYTA
jgi:hypothetical protein